MIATQKTKNKVGADQPNNQPTFQPTIGWSVSRKTHDAHADRAVAEAMQPNIVARRLPSSAETISAFFTSTPIVRKRCSPAVVRLLDDATLRRDHGLGVPRVAHLVVGRLRRADHLVTLLHGDPLRSEARPSLHA